ncbi:MAG TPA: serine/threonine-protein kinase [Kofleriaceae bacterium]|nr:serine/threonine-protein kinase [Kofleriaceae bacterium]
MQTQVATAGVATSEPTDELPVGAMAGPWRVEHELGRGGMGSVYAVTHAEIGKRAALKVMHHRWVGPAAAERVLLEARVVNQVGHPNIVDIFETGELPDGRPYMVMERLDGVSLGARAREGKILPDTVVDILLQISDALIAAHAVGVIHRDLKLDNVFLTDNADDPSVPRAKLLDWGIAKVIGGDKRTTQEGMLIGTPQYVSPEQARGAVVTEKTDVYSLGVMAFELFVEQLPFDAETAAELMTMHMREAPPAPSELWPDIPDELEALLVTMLAKDPEARPSMLSVAHSLERIKQELDRRRVLAPPLRVTFPSVTIRPRRRPRWELVVGGLALAASAMMFVLTRDVDSDAATILPHTRAAAAAALPAPAAAGTGVGVRELHAAAERPAPTPTPAPAPAPVRVALRAKHHATAPHVKRARKAPVTPRRDLAFDPDGTIDPYR